MCFVSLTNFLIHDYFFAKTLDKVRPGGIVAFVTSKGTMDKKNPEVRKYLAQRAELLGAVRLPNTAFKENAGTEVTSDILFLKKRELYGDVERYRDFMEALERVSPVPIRYEGMEGDKKGYFIDLNHPIAIKEGMSETQTAKTGVHEVAHANFWT